MANKTSFLMRVIVHVFSIAAGKHRAIHSPCPHLLPEDNAYPFGDPSERRPPLPDHPEYRISLHPIYQSEIPAHWSFTPGAIQAVTYRRRQLLAGTDTLHPSQSCQNRNGPEKIWDTPLIDTPLIYRTKRIKGLNSSKMGFPCVPETKAKLSC